jgi:hypothetical protein
MKNADDSGILLADATQTVLPESTRLKKSKSTVHVNQPANTAKSTFPAAAAKQPEKPRKESKVECGEPTRTQKPEAYHVISNKENKAVRDKLSEQKRVLGAKCSLTRACDVDDDADRPGLVESNQCNVEVLVGQRAGSKFVENAHPDVEDSVEDLFGEHKDRRSGITEQQPALLRSP